MYIYLIWTDKDNVTICGIKFRLLSTSGYLYFFYYKYSIIKLSV